MPILTNQSAEAFRKNLRDGIDELDVSDSEFARRAGIHVTLIWKYIKGDSKPGLDQLDRLADAMEITTAELITPKN